MNNQPIKGALYGKCNRTVCTTTGTSVIWYNRYTLKHYCGKCAYLINNEDCNIRSAERDFGKGERICINPKIKNDKPKEQPLTMNAEYGKFYGFKQCCIDAFGDVAVPLFMRSSLVQKHSMVGFIPCEECAKKLENDPNYKQELINEINKNRFCMEPFTGK